jgi:hypothetical protein
MLFELHRFQNMTSTDCEGVEGRSQGFQVFKKNFSGRAE